MDYTGYESMSDAELERLVAMRADTTRLEAELCKRWRMDALRLRRWEDGESDAGEYLGSDS